MILICEKYCVPRILKLPQQLLQGQELAALAIVGAKKVFGLRSSDSPGDGKQVDGQGSRYRNIIPAAGGLLPESQECHTDRWGKDGVPSKEAASMG